MGKVDFWMLREFEVLEKRLCTEGIHLLFRLGKTLGIYIYQSHKIVQSRYLPFQSPTCNMHRKNSTSVKTNQKQSFKDRNIMEP